MDFNPFSSEFFDDPYETYRWLRDEAPASAGALPTGGDPSDDAHRDHFAGPGASR